MYLFKKVTPQPMYEVLHEKNPPPTLKELYEYAQTLSLSKGLVEVIYWRKANEIHNWFVTNLANGVDDCSPIHCTYTDLFNLKTDVEMVLNSESNEVATEILPTVQGFFFGSTEYDRWYWASMAETAEKLNKLLKEFEFNTDQEFVYQASW